MILYETCEHDLARLLANIVVDANGCWIWQKALDRNGYGRFSVSGITLRAHRASIWLHRGELPIEGAVVHHICEVRSCINPDHLAILSWRANLMASDTPARRNAEKTECKYRHPYTTENTRYSNNGRRRHCNTCERSRPR